MGKLAKHTEAARILQAMQVLQLITRGMSKQEACDTIGMSVWQYENWIAQESDAIDEMQKSIAEAERIRLSDISSHQARLLEKLIGIVLNPAYQDPKMMLDTLKYLDVLRGSLEGKHGLHTQTDKAADYLLTGPTTRSEDSQMAVQHELSRSTVNIKTRPDGSVDLTVPDKTHIVELFKEDIKDPPEKGQTGQPASRGD